MNPDDRRRDTLLPATSRVYAEYQTWLARTRKGLITARSLQGEAREEHWKQWEFFWKALDASGEPFPEKWTLNRFRMTPCLIRSTEGMDLWIKVRVGKNSPGGFYWSYENLSGITYDIALHSLRNVLTFTEDLFRAKERTS